MWKAWSVGLALLVAAAFLPGCGPPGTVQEKTIQIKMPGGVEKAKNLLKNYASGQPMTSEVSGFPDLVEEVRAEDPAKADVLKQGLDDLQKHKSELRSRAAELLKKL